MIEKFERQGIHRIYKTDKGFIWVGACLNSHVYKIPGYYVSLSSCQREKLTGYAGRIADIERKPFETCREAFNAIYSIL